MEREMSINGSYDILTVPEIAERLRVGQKWVYTHIEFLGGYKIGKYVRFYWPTVLERLRGGRRTESQPLGSQPNDLPEKP
jgi:hypothetical protein